MNDAVLTLIQETHSRNDYGVDITTETSRTVFCSLKSVNRSDFYSAGQAGFALDHVFVTDPINYNGEQLAEYLGTRYEITRVYQASIDKLEIYAGHKVGVFQ